MKLPSQCELLLLEKPFLTNFVMESLRR